MNITEILVQPQDSVWLPWIVQYFFYIGSAYAAAALFFLSLAFRQKTSHALRSALALTLVISAIVGPLALTADLHQPGRAWHFFAHPTPWSWMSLGSVLLPIFSALAVMTGWLYLREDLRQMKNSNSPVARVAGLLTLGEWRTTDKMIKVMSLLTTISGLSIALYTGAEIYSVESRPLWNQVTSPLLWLVSAFMGGLGLTLILLCLMPQQALRFADRQLVRFALSLSALGSLVLFGLWLSPSHPLLEEGLWSNRILVMNGLLVLTALATYLLKKAEGGRASLLVTAALAIASSWSIRWITIMDVQTLPLFDKGPYPYELPMGSAGLLGILGMAGLWLAIAAIASEVVSNDSQNATSTAHA